MYGKGKRKSGSNPLIKAPGDFEITKDESADWQKLADITPNNFEHAMNEAQADRFADEIIEIADEVKDLTGNNRVQSRRVGDQPFGDIQPSPQKAQLPRSSARKR